MSLSDQHERQWRAAQDAASWLLRLEADDMSAAERGDFIDWLRESPLHVAEMLRADATHGLLNEFRGWQGVNTDSPSVTDNVVSFPHDASLPTHRSRTWQRSLQIVTTLAACFALLLVGGLIVSHFQQPSRDPTEIQTQRSEYREIRLADGSLLEVAPDSELHLHFTRQQRDVTLDRGQALFHVAKDASRPFVVTAGETRVRAVGTAFSVDRSNASITVTVAEGKVAVTLPSTSSIKSRTTPATNSMALVAGEQVVIDPAVITPTVQAVDSRAELAWARGMLIFDRNTVAEVVQRFNLSNRVQLRVLNPALANRPVSGVFDVNDPQSFVSFLQNVAGAQVTQNSPNEIVIGMPANPSTMQSELDSTAAVAVH